MPIAKSYPAALVLKQQTITAVAVGNRQDAAEVMDFAARGIVKTHYRLEKMDRLTEVSTCDWDAHILFEGADWRDAGFQRYGREQVQRTCCPGPPIAAERAVRSGRHPGLSELITRPVGYTVMRYLSALSTSQLALLA